MAIVKGPQLLTIFTGWKITTRVHFLLKTY